MFLAALHALNLKFVNGDVCGDQYAVSPPASTAPSRACVHECVPACPPFVAAPVRESVAFLSAPDRRLDTARWGTVRVLM